MRQLLLVVALLVIARSVLATEPSVPAIPFDHDEPIADATVVGHGQAALLATADRSGHVQLRTLTGQFAGRATLPPGQPHLAASADPPLLWLASHLGVLQTWDPATARLSQVPLPVTGPIDALGASPNGQHVVAVVGGTVLRVDPKTREVRMLGRTGTALQATATDRGWVVVRAAGALQAWSPDDRRVRLFPGHADRQAQFDPSSRLLASTGDVLWVAWAGQAIAWRLTDSPTRLGQMILRSARGCVPLSAEALMCVRQKPPGRPVLLPRKLGEAARLEQNPEVQRTLATMDGRLVVEMDRTVAGETDRATGSLAVWSGQAWSTWPRQVDTVRTTATSPDGRTLAVAWQQGQVSLHALPDGRTLRTWAGPAGNVVKLGFAANGTLHALDDEGQGWVDTGAQWQAQGDPLGFVTLLASPLPTGEAWISWPSSRPEPPTLTGVWTPGRGVREIPVQVKGPASVDSAGQVRIVAKEGPLSTVVDPLHSTGTLFGSTCDTRAVVWDARQEKAAIATWDGQLCLATAVPLGATCTPSDETPWLWSADGRDLLLKRESGPWPVRDGRTLSPRGQVRQPEGVEADTIVAWQDRRLLTVVADEAGPVVKVVDLDTHKQWLAPLGPVPPQLQGVYVRLARAVKTELSELVQRYQFRGIESIGQLFRLMLREQDRSGVGELLARQVTEHLHGDGRPTAVLVQASPSAKFAVVQAESRIQVRRAGDLAEVLDVPGQEGEIDAGDRLLLVSKGEPALWDLRTGKKLVSFSSPRCNASDVTFVDRARWVVASSPQGYRASHWPLGEPWVDLKSPHLPRGRSPRTLTLRVARTAPRVALFGHGQALVHDLDHPDAPWDVTIPRKIQSFQLSGDGRRIVTMDTDCVVRIHEPGQPPRAWPMPGTCRDASLELPGPDGRQVLVLQDSHDLALVLDGGTGEWRRLDVPVLDTANLCHSWPDSGEATCQPPGDPNRRRDDVWHARDGAVVAVCPQAMELTLAPGVVGCKRPGGGLEVFAARTATTSQRIAVTPGPVARTAGP